MRLAGKVAFISGGARGMGAAMVRLFALEGARVGFGDVLEREGRLVEAEVTKAGGEAFFVRLDVTKAGEWRDALQSTVARYGPLNILVNNAGILRMITREGQRQRMGIEDTPEEVWDEVMEVNVKGVFLGTKEALPELRKAGGGSIINISSIAAMIGHTSSVAYATSKGAVRTFTKAAAIEHAQQGIRVNSIHPGLTVTPMVQYILGEGELRSGMLNEPPLGKLGRPEDIAYGALYLASDESSFVTGAELVIDGGTIAG